MGQDPAVNATVVRTIDLLRSRGITAVLTVLTHADVEKGDVVGVSAIIDTWLLVKNLETDGERNRLLYIVKSRGSNHSNQVREFRLTSQGPELVDVVIGPAGVITGSSRLIFEDNQKRLALSSLNEMKRKHRSLQRHRLEIESQIELLRSQFQEDSDELELITLEEESAVETEASLGLLRSQHRGEIQ